jgi:autotransporter-associated beta strand protein
MKTPSGKHIARFMIAAALAASAPAATLTWNGGEAGEWRDGGAGWTGGSWNNATPDTAVFAGAEPVTVTIHPGGVTVADLTVSSGNYGFAGFGALTFGNGTVNIAPGFTAAAGVPVSASGSILKSGGGALTLAHSGNSINRLRINGGAVNVTGGLLCHGSGAVAVADYGGASLNIDGGSLAISGTREFVIGLQSTGAVNVSGGSLDVAAGVTIGIGSHAGTIYGNSGNGTLAISGGTATIQGTSSESIFLARPRADNLSTGNFTGTVDLTGGVLATARGFREGTNITGGTKTSTINLNGGTLRAHADHSNWIDASIDTLAIGSSGATIDTNGFHVTIAKGASGGGALTKTGAGVLRMTGVNAATGPLIVEQGTFSAGNPQALEGWQVELHGGVLKLDGPGNYAPSSLSAASSSALDLGFDGASVTLPAPAFSGDAVLSIHHWRPGAIRFTSPPAPAVLARFRHAGQPMLAAALAADGSLDFPTARPPGLKVVAGTLTRDGRPFRGIGVNYYDAFNRMLMNGADTSHRAGFTGLAQTRIPFARLDLSGYWPIHLKLYQENPAEYLARLDRLVESAEEHGVGLIPSFFWTTFAVPDLVGEPLNQWGVPNSATRGFMRQWVGAVVSRYRSSPAILAWEFGNEWNLAVDLPNAAEHRPPTWVDLGNPATRSSADDLTTPIVRDAWIEFAQLVRSLDPDRPLSTGHAEMRASQWHQYRWINGHIPVSQAWTTDSPAETREIALFLNPAPFDLFSIHSYAPTPALYHELAADAGQPLFIGEFGVPDSHPDPAAAFADLLASVKPAPISAMWVYDRGVDPFNVTTFNSRAWMLGSIQPSPFVSWMRGTTPPDLRQALFKYAFGAAGYDFPAPGADTGISDGAYLEMTAVVRTDDPALLVRPEWSADPDGDWWQTGVSESASPDASALPAGCERRVYRIPMDGEPRAFLRLRATLDR